MNVRAPDQVVQVKVREASERHGGSPVGWWGNRSPLENRLSCINRVGRLADGFLERLSPMSVFKRRRFLAKALKVMRNWPPVSITTDKLGSYRKALRRLKRKGELKDTVQHRTSKYLNNRIEADHGALKRLIRPTRGFLYCTTVVRQAAALFMRPDPWPVAGRP